MRAVRFLALVILAMGLALLLAACGPKPPDPAELLSQAADAITQAESLQFSLERQGDPLQINLGMASASILGAEGAYQAPRSVHATVRVELQGTVADAEVLWIPDGIFLKLPPLIANFMPVNIGGTIDASMIFSEESGIPYVFKQQLTSASLVGEEDLEGVKTYHITAQADGAQLSGLVGGAVAPGIATVDVWIEKETSQAVRISLTESDGNGWLIELFAYGEPVEIPTP